MNRRLLSALILGSLGLSVGYATPALAAQKSITINNGSEPESLDPNKTSGVPESSLSRQLLEGLVNTDDKGATVPGVASSWETKDNKVWIFHLRHDAKWSNGDPVTAHDFIYAWQRIITPETASPYASYMADDMHVLNAAEIVAGKLDPSKLGVRALDDHTLEVTLEAKLSYFPATLAHSSTYPLHRGTIEKYGDKWTLPGHFVGNGAYQLSDWVINSHIDMVRNPYYWDNANTKIDKIRFLAISSESDDVNRYLTSGEDVSNGISSEILPKLRKQIPDEIKTMPYLCTYYYEFNLAKPPFNDWRARQALNLALDRRAVTDKILKNGQEPAYTLTPSFTDSYEVYRPDWADHSMKDRIAEAKKLLKQAGYSTSHPLKFQLLYNTSEGHRKLAVAVSAMYRKLGGLVQVELVNQEWKTYLATRRNGEYQMARAGWCADYNSPANFQNILLSNNSQNHGRYNSRAFDQMLASTLEAGISLEERVKRHQKASEIVSKDVPIIPVYSYTRTRLVKPWVKGVSNQDPMDNYRVKNWDIQK